jgi:hypothetical protein
MTTGTANFDTVSSIASLTPTVAHLFAAALPALASEGPIESVLEMHKRIDGGKPIERCLIYCPDALGVHIWRSCMNAIIFAPDHGAHIDSASGHGDHGVDIPEDMQLFHWYGINSAHTYYG